MRLLITGSAGMVGGRLSEHLRTRFALAGTRHEAEPPPGLETVPLDLLEPSGFEPALAAARCDAVVHAAAFADADACERDPERARAANVTATETLAQLCRRDGRRLLMLSTDLVFDGSKSHYREDEAARPLLEYGRTKLAAEAAVLAASSDHVVFRIALVAGGGFGPRSTASEGILWALRAGRRVRLFTDQFRTPVDTRSLADAIARVLDGGPGGLYHIGGPERLSRHAIGVRTANAFSLDASLIDAATQATTPIGVPRPADVSMDSSKAFHAFGWKPRSFDDAIRESRVAFVSRVPLW